MTDDDDHDRGLSHDLATLLNRRRALGILASAGAAGVLGACDQLPFLFGQGAQAEVAALGSDGGECVAHPRETAGPFPADGSNRVHGTLANVLDDSGIIRVDMRGDVGGDADSQVEGVPLDLALRVVDVSNQCKPLEGFVVYLWHCDAEGRYSLYNVADTSFLRAVGAADADGVVRFKTIIPGCYRGRYPHMHFEVYRNLQEAVDYRKRLLTSQLAIPASVVEPLYKSAPSYASSLKNYAVTPPLERDGIFADNTAKQIAAQTIEITGDPEKGYVGSAVIGLTT